MLPTRIAFNTSTPDWAEHGEQTGLAFLNSPTPVSSTFARYTYLIHDKDDTTITTSLSNFPWHQNLAAHLCLWPTIRRAPRGLIHNHSGPCGLLIHVI